MAGCMQRNEQPQFPVGIQLIDGWLCKNGGIELV